MGNPLISGGSLFKHERNMKIKILKPVVAAGKPRKKGDVIEANQNEAEELILFKDAEKHVEKKPAGRPKNN